MWGHYELPTPCARAPGGSELERVADHLTLAAVSATTRPHPELDRIVDLTLAAVVADLTHPHHQ